QEGDILVVPTLTCLYSNIRELCCLMYIVEDTGIIIQSSDMDLSSDSDSSDWIIASQLAHLDYLHYLRQKRASKAIKKAKYQSMLNTGGRHKRVITPIYRQAYEYLQSQDRKSTRLNSSHVSISYAVFCLKKKNNK